MGDFVHVQQPYTALNGIMRHFEAKNLPHDAKSSHKKKCCGIKVYNKVSVGGHRRSIAMTANIG